MIFLNVKEYFLQRGVSQIALASKWDISQRKRNTSCSERSVALPYSHGGVMVSTGLLRLDKRVEDSRWPLKKRELKIKR